MPAQHSLSLSSPGNALTVISIQQLRIARAGGHQQRQASMAKGAQGAGFRVLACSHDGLDGCESECGPCCRRALLPWLIHQAPKPAPILWGFMGISNMAARGPSATPATRPHVPSPPHQRPGEQRASCGNPSLIPRPRPNPHE